MMMNRLLFLSTALGASLALPLSAQQVFDLDEITFTANRKQTELKRTGATVSVITRMDIEASGATTVSDLIARLPGVTVSATGPVGTQTSVRIRGLHPRFTAVLIDGVLVNDPSLSDGAVDFGAFLTSDIERIEVLRGAQSALYGGSAVAGVISITTVTAQEDGLRQRAEILGGSYGTLKASYGATWRDGPVDGSFTLSHSSATGFSASDGQPEPDGHSIQRLSFGLNYQSGEALRFGLSVFSQRAWSEYDDWPVDGAFDQDRNELGARAYAKLSMGRSTHLFELTGLHIARENRDSLPGRFEGTRFGLAYRGETEFSPAFTLQYGADLSQETAFGRTIPAGTSSTVTGAYLQALWAPTAQLDISASARVDSNSTFGTFPTGRLAVSYRPTDRLTLTASLGTAFRAPSIEQRFGVSGGSFPFLGDPTLTPETATSFDLGADFALPRDGLLGLRLFHTSTDNLIASTWCPYDFVTNACVAGTFNSVANIPGVSTSTGAEVSLRMPLSDRITIGGSYTYTNALQASGARVNRVPLHEASLTLDASLTDRLSGGLNVKHVANRIDFRTDYSTGPMPDYTVVGLTARYALTDKADAILRIDNLLDTHFQEAAGFGSTGRAFYVGLAARF